MIRRGEEKMLRSLNAKKLDTTAGIYLSKTSAKQKVEDEID
jgi:hypothetical protein